MVRRTLKSPPISSPPAANAAGTTSPIPFFDLSTVSSLSGLQPQLIRLWIRRRWILPAVEGSPGRGHGVQFSGDQLYGMALLGALQREGLRGSRVTVEAVLERCMELLTGDYWREQAAALERVRELEELRGKRGRKRAGGRPLRVSLSTPPVVSPAQILDLPLWRDRNVLRQLEAVHTHVVQEYIEQTR